MEKGPHVPVMAVEDPANKHNFKCKVCQSTLELEIWGKGQWLCTANLSNMCKILKAEKVLWQLC